MGIGPTSTLLVTLSTFGFHSEITTIDIVTSSSPAAESTDLGRDPAAFERALVALDDASLVANTDPEQGIVLLNRALSALHQFAPLLALDEAARTRRSLAHLSLARAKLARGDEQGAIESMDATLRELGDIDLEVEQLGPSLGRLLAERRTALEAFGGAHLRVTCTTDCDVWIDERATTEQALAAEGIELMAGGHRVWIEDRSGRLEPLRASVELGAGESDLVELHYPAPAAPAPELPTSPPTSIADRPIADRGDRLAPRWAELLTGSLGVATLGAGAALWAIDSTCPGGVEPSDIQACPQLYDTRTAGITTLALGSAMLVTGVVLLTVDEVRQRRRSRGLAHHGLLGVRF